MKRLHLLLWILLLPLGMMAGSINEQQARQIAEQFFTTDGSANGQRRAPAAPPQLTYTSEASELYVFNQPGGGWVIVAGDDGACSTILAYSDTGTFDYEKAPDVAKIFLRGYADGIRQLRQTGRRAAAPATTIRRAGATESMEPLLKTTWNQTTPYNNLCPEAANGGMEGYGGRCPSGCVPVAIAQIMNYWQWPKQGYGKHTNRNTPTQTVDFTQSTYDWDNMLDSYAGEYNEVQAQAVARLMADVGCAMHTIYTGGESGTPDDFCQTAYNFLFRYFDYSPYVTSDWWRDAGINGVSYADWLKAELRAKRPVFCIGSVRGYETHAVVCDGFRYYEDGFYVGDQKRFNFFHINFGWGGQCDGYYSDDTTEMDFYTLNHWGAEFIGFRPNDLPRILKDNNYYLIRDQEAQLVGLYDEGCTDTPVKVTVHDEVEYNGKTYPVTSIYPELFHYMYVSEITYSKNMKRIPGGLFTNYYFGDYPLQRINLPEGIEEISDSAFLECRNLTSWVTFPTTLRRVGKRAFASTNIGVFEFKGKGFVIDDYGLASSSEKSVYGLEGAAKIGEGGTGRLMGDFIISPTCQYGESAINGRFNSIILPKGLTTYNPDMFNKSVCTAAYVVRKDNPNYTTSNDILFNKDQTTLVAIPSLERSGSSLVDRDRVDVPVGVTTIARRAFAPGPSRIQIPASVKKLDGAFIGCNPRYLTVLATTPPVINDSMTFNISNINSPGRPCKLIVPHGCKAAYQQANGWKDFQNIEEGSIYVQGQYCYEALGDELACIVNRNCEVAFDGHAVIPATVTIDGVSRKISDISEGAFQGDLALKTVTIPKEVDYLSTQFIDCDNLYAVNVAAGNSRYHSTDGMLFANVWNENTLMYCPPMQQQGSSIVVRDHVVIPSETEVIAVKAFAKNLRRVTFPASVKRINENAFAQCTRLSVIICQGTEPPAYVDGGYAFPLSVYQTATVYIPKGCTEAYRNTWTGGFRSFVNIVEYDPATFDPDSINDGEEKEPEGPEFYDPDHPDFPDEPDDPDEPETQEAIAVHRANGQVEYFAFAERPVVTYEGDNLVMSCGNTRVLYTLKGLEKITFTTLATGIGETPRMEEPVFHFDNHQIQIANAKAGQQVRLFDMTGMTVRTDVIGYDGQQTISLESLPKGIYIVQLGNTTYKILKR